MGNMKIVDGTHVQLKSDSTTSIDVHLNKPNQFVNIILSNGNIIKVTSDIVLIYDDTDTLLKEIDLYKVNKMVV